MVIGRVDEIRKWAEEEKAQVTERELVSQFRCNGSDGYLAWLDHTLEIRDTANLDMEDISDINDTRYERLLCILYRSKSGSLSEEMCGDTKK